MIHLRLKEAIIKFGLKYEDFGKKINLDVNAIRNMASNRKTITPEIALLIEEQFNINPCWLIFGRGNMINAQFDLSGEDKEILTSKEINDKMDFLLKEVEELKKKK